MGRKYYLDPDTGQKIYIRPTVGKIKVKGVNQNGTDVVDGNGIAQITTPTKTSQLTNDSGYVTNSYHDSTKVDKVSGKGLSTNDFTNQDKQDISTLKSDIVNKQNKLIAGENITIASDGKTISATGVGYFTIVNGKLNMVFEGE